MPNRLASATSPYLQQHAQNPVDWFEWGDEAFAEARRRDVPLLISIGYAACHWCHVMAHESFEDPGTAAYLNEHFVAVKVDREERPDVDAVYMEATQAMTGSGGWPMTVFATPDGDPFSCGTYFPPRPLHGMPSFGQVLSAMHDAWTTRRTDVDVSAAAIREALVGHEPGGALPGAGPNAPSAPARALEVLAGTFDAARGGFGGAPKFPPSMLLEWLLRHGVDPTRPGAPLARAMAAGTLDAMARGGMYDQLGGGFARYSVDAAWVVPHFEKMLYDNALLLRVYAHWWRATGSPLAHRVVEETAGWLLRELRTDEGGFASALDADSPGPDGGSREGAFSVWTPRELVEVLGPDDGAWAAAVWGVTELGTFEQGASVLQLRADPPPEEAGRYASVRTRLFEARASRPRPARDDKVVAAWNGLAVAALADAGDLFGRPDWIGAAAGAADLLLDVHARRDGPVLRLARTSRDGVVGSAPGVLEDYADVAEGALALYRATGDPRWVEHAGELLEEVLGRFGDGAGGCFDTADDETDPVLARIRRPHDPADGPTPSGQAAAAGALLTFAALTGSHRHREAAERVLVEPLALAERYPRAAGWALAVAEAVLDGPREVAVVGPAGDVGTDALRRVAVLTTAPGAVLATGPAVASDRSARVGLLQDRPLVDGRPTAYVCRGFVCDRPTTDPDELAALLAP
ncbi:MAG TPA: thioredoxin domain-containing protein [Cellulomonas sp.]|uniref:thioredoxin domain-containing protein n=1 Tax=Cellulomonas sp. TaxID=40001 RepID=UPI002E323C39|nr:thioredoxin domain-containing protein [Cellulomonas sp.]HEX5333220.1 thioredoxin domain-containing protein [Cellulomonas sp.]